MKFIFIVGVIFSLILSYQTTLGEDYHVDIKNGNDNFAGTQESPWQTILKANATLLPGDRVFIHQGEYSNQQIAPKNSGKSGMPITYLAFENEIPTITNVKNGILLDKKKYIIVDGIYIDGKELYTSSGINQWAQLHDTHYCIIRNCNFKYAKGWAGVSLDGGSSFNQLLNNRMDYCGIWNDKNGEDKGDMISMKCANNNLLEGNYFTHGGHNLLSIFGEFNIIRDNIFDNSWGTDNAGNQIGNRCLSLTNSDGKSCSGNIGGYNVFERNIVRNAYKASDNNYPQTMKAEGENQIVRFNTIYNGVHSGISGSANSKVKYTRYQRTYNNTIYNSGGPSWRIDHSKGLDTKENVFKNNISYDVGIKPKNSKYGGHVFLNVSQANNGIFNGNKVQGNCFYSLKGENDQLYVDKLGMKSVKVLADLYPDEIKNNIVVQPHFSSPHPALDGDFSLSESSPLIDAGVSLTYITSSKGSGNLIQVEDARYFTDGFGITEGDLIQIGNNLPVRIKDVDYKKNQLTIATRISWQKGDFVNLQFYGNGPDIGAFEYKKGSVNDNLTEISITGSLNFGEVEVGGSITKEITINNSGKKPLKIENVILPKGFIADWEKAEIEVGSSKILKVTFTPEVVGSYEETLVIKGNILGNQLTKSVDGVGKKKSETLESEVSFLLIDEEKRLIIDSLTDRHNIFLNDWQNIPLNIEASLSKPVGSVILYLNNSEFAVENQQPYLLTEKGDFLNLNPGTYELTARVFSEKNGLGYLLTTRTISISLINASSTDFVIISPGEGSTFETKEEISIVVNIPDYYGEGKVEYFANGLRLGELNQKPYDFKWRFLNQGEYKITAKKTKETVIEVTPAITIHVNNSTNYLPEIAIITPKDSALFPYGNEIFIESSVSDKDGTIDQVIFLNGGDTLRKINSSPYNFLWKYPEPGNYQVSAIAIDNDGGMSESDIINILVRNQKEEIDSDSTFNQANIEYGPNPFSTYLGISLNNMKEDKGTLSIVETSGKEIIRKEFLIKDEVTILVEDTFLWKRGLYILRLIFPDQSVSFKVIKI